MCGESKNIIADGELIFRSVYKFPLFKIRFNLGVNIFLNENMRILLTISVNKKYDLTLILKIIFMREFS